MVVMVPVVFDYIDVHHPDTGEVVRAMVPIDRYRKVAGKQFVIGEQYPLVVLEARSRKSHGAYFAAVNDAFKNLPEEYAARWTNAEHLRKWVLIETGWCDENESYWESQRDAMRFVAFYRENVDEYARFNVRQTMASLAFNDHTGPDRKVWQVLTRRAKSQSAAAMAKGPFEESKKAVLDYLESVIGLPRGDLRIHAGRHD